MKALQMLDHVMLWFARGGAIILLLCIIRSIPDFCDGYGYYSLGGPRPILPIIHHWSDVLNWGGLDLLTFLLATVFLNVSLWNLKRDYFRLYLLMCSSLMLVCNLCGSGIWWRDSNWRTSALALLFCYVAMAWTGLRAPGQPKMRYMRLAPSF